TLSTVFNGAITSSRALRLQRKKTTSAEIMHLLLSQKTPINIAVVLPPPVDTWPLAFASERQLSVALAGNSTPLNMYLPLLYSLH
ncbi:hypothetical protein PFISCL1PPCAC_9034, partial [Pristionchus fissidentatus]